MDHALPVDSLPATPLPGIVEALARVAPLAGLTPAEFEWLAGHGSERFARQGEVIFNDGDPAEHMTILLRGEIHVRRDHSGPISLFVGRSAQITGLLPFSRMKTYGGRGTAASELWALMIHRSEFAAMLEAVPSMGPRCISALLDRVREITRMEQQGEKLQALGKLAGNLAHELNNPASAAQRAARGMMSELDGYGRESYRLGALGLSEEQMAGLRAWERALVAAGSRPVAGAGTAALEDELTRWMSGHGVDEPWRIAPELAELGIRAGQLEPLSGFLDSAALPVVLLQFVSRLRGERIAEAMLDSTARIFDLISAIKAYSYLDQAPIQEVDIPQSLETTLQMMQSRLGEVSIEREYEPGLPRLSVYGSELNQVWTALIENALDAMGDRGCLRLVCRSQGELMLIEVWDNGPGIPTGMENRVFEPFFTTKAPGQGLGLGLDNAMRVVRMHRGFLSVHSRPGETCFRVRLPIEQLQAY